MKPERSFVAERIAAQHCAELVRRGPEPGELLPQLARSGEKLAAALAPLLAGLLGGDAPTITVKPPRESAEAELAQEIGALAANCLLATPVPGVTLLASIEGRAMLRLVDRAFGGKGEAPERLPERFPLSAELMIQRIEGLAVRAAAAALGGEVRALRRDSKIAELAPFPAGIKLATLQLEIAEGVKAPWKITFALPMAMLPKLLGLGLDGPARPPRAADPAAAPFADMPLPLTATLVDMRMPLSALTGLAPGVVLPVAVARAVPISVRGTMIARGSVGAQDDCVALKLTQIA